MRIAVVGHVEHVSVGRVPALPGEGGIAHLEDLHVFPGGGGGVTFFQLVKSPAEIHLFTALGNDQAAQEIEARLAKTGARIHAARRSEPQTRDVVQDIYLRKVERKDGQLHNVEFDVVKDVKDPGKTR